MNFDDLQSLWQSPANNPEPNDMKKQKEEFVSKLRREYRGFRLHMTLVFGALAVLTVKIVHHVLTQDALPQTKAIDLTSEWALIPFLALPWIAAIYFVRLHLKHRRSHPDYDQTISATLRAMVDSTASAMKRMKTMISLYIIGIPICALVMNQIQEAGKIRPHELKSMIALFGGITVIALACFAYEYFRNLVPRKRRLDALLEDYRISDVNA